MNLGSNTVYLEVEEMLEMGLSRVEVCLGRRGTYEQRLKNVLSDMKIANEKNLPLSVHLPIYMYDWFPYDYLDAFFMDSDINKRNLSFKLVEENLKELENYAIDYCVLHFPGLYFNQEKTKAFDQLLHKSLKRLNALAKKYNQKILLEYFGSNSAFYKIADWIEIINSYNSLGILLDTGHLFFASIQRNFDFYDAFETLSSACDAFHLWTTKGDKAYGENAFYQQYHHIILNKDQSEKNEWAFNTDKILKKLRTIKKPIIIEASKSYKGEEYFRQGLEYLREKL